MMKKPIFAVIIVFSLSACSLLQRNSQQAPPAVQTMPQAGAAANNDGLAPESEIDKIIAETNPVLAEMSAADGEKVPIQIPLEINRKVAEWINFFTVKERERTQRYLERGELIRPHIEQLLKDNDVPKELYYLAMIESGFVSQARSRARAVGVWQFMKGTGKNYGLTVDRFVDERKNWIKATEAAASYLKDLNNVFGSWYLALAAYNAGEHRIVRSIMKGKTRDFWALAEAGLLPRETLNYVPKFLAAQIVGKNYKKYGFELNIDPQDTWEDYDVASVPSGVALSEIARVTGVPHETLKRWNMDLVRGITPYSKTGSVDIYVPKSMLNKIEENRLAIEKVKRVRVSAPETRTFASRSLGGDDDGDYDIYVVKRGDTLFAISKRLGISSRTLMKINGLRHSRIHAGQRLRYYSVASSAGPTSYKRSQHTRKIASSEPRKSKKRKVSQE